MKLPTSVEYPVIAIGDLHGQVEWLDKLVAKLEKLPEWPAARLVFLGDLVDRNDTVKELVSRVMELVAAKPGSTCVMGNHDLALVAAAGLGGPPSDWWASATRTTTTTSPTFRSYLGKEPEYYSAGRLAATNCASCATRCRRHTASSSRTCRGSRRPTGTSSSTTDCRRNWTAPDRCRSSA